MICFKSHPRKKEVLRRNSFFVNILTHIFHDFVLFLLITVNFTDNQYAFPRLLAMFGSSFHLN